MLSIVASTCALPSNSTVLPRSRVARQPRMAERSVAMTATTTADVWIVELICDLFPGSLNGGLRQTPVGGKPPAIVTAARFFHHHSWHHNGNYRTSPRGSIEQRYLRTQRRRQITMSQKDQTRGHPKFLNDGHPHASSLPASALREGGSRAECSQELSPKPET